MIDYTKYISIDSNIRFGKPCVTGTRISVYDVLNWLANGMSIQQIIEDYPELSDTQIHACLAYAADREHKLKVRELGLENLPDIQIWEYAKKHEYSIVSFDADYYDIANLKGHPPKIVWLRIGNTTTENRANIFIERYELLRDFIENPDNGNLACLEIEH